MTQNYFSKFQHGCQKDDCVEHWPNRLLKKNKKILEEENFNWVLRTYLSKDLTVQNY